MTRPNEKCKYCGTLMNLDDVDYSFEGNEDRYYVCPKCNALLLVKVRYKKIQKKIYRKGEQQ